MNQFRTLTASVQGSAVRSGCHGQEINLISSFMSGARRHCRCGAASRLVMPDWMKADDPGLDLILLARHQNGNLPAVILLNHHRLAESDHEDGIQSHLHLLIAGRSHSTRAGKTARHIRHRSPQEQLKPALFRTQGGQRAIQLERGGNLGIIDLHRLFLKCIQIEGVFRRCEPARCDR